MRFRLTFVSASCALLVSLALAVTASAASGAGAQVRGENYQCETFEFGTFCFGYHFVSHSTSTPSGLRSVITNGRYEQSLIATDGTCSFAESGEEHFHGVYSPDLILSDVEESSYKQEFLFQSECQGGDTVVCTTVLHYHEVDGVLQFVRFVPGECTVEPASA